MDTVSNFPAVMTSDNNDYSSKNLDSLIVQGHNLNALQLLNRDVLVARGDAALETQRTANELVAQIASTRETSRIETLQAKHDLADKIREEGEKTRAFFRDTQMQAQTATIADLKAQVVALTNTLK